MSAEYDDKKDESSDKPASFTFVMECKDSGAYQTFHHDADSREEARPHLERKASQAGWNLDYCKIL
jgi:hypothetical protein